MLLMQTMYMDVYGLSQNGGIPKTIGFNTQVVNFWTICEYPHFRKPPYIIYNLGFIEVDDDCMTSPSH